MAAGKVAGAQERWWHRHWGATSHKAEPNGLHPRELDALKAEPDTSRKRESLERCSRRFRKHLQTLERALDKSEQGLGPRYEDLWGACGGPLKKTEKPCPIHRASGFCGSCHRLKRRELASRPTTRYTQMPDNSLNPPNSLPTSLPNSLRTSGGPFKVEATPEEPCADGRSSGPRPGKDRSWPPGGLSKPQSVGVPSDIFFLEVLCRWHVAIARQQAGTS